MRECLGVFNDASSAGCGYHCALGAERRNSSGGRSNVKVNIKGQVAFP